jgi:hypothetical protein
MPKSVAIEGYRRIEVGDAKQKIVELSKQRSSELITDGRAPLF